MTELSIAPGGFFGGETRLSTQPQVATFDPTKSKNLLSRIDDIEKRVSEKIDTLDEKQKARFEQGTDYLRSRFVAKSKNQGFDQQELILDALKKNLKSISSSQDPDDQDFKMFLRDPSIFDTKFLQGTPDFTLLDSKVAFSDYFQTIKFKESIFIVEPPGTLYNFINFGGGLLLGGGFAANFLLKANDQTSSLASTLFLSNPASATLSIISLGVSLTDDFQKVLRYGDSFERIPRNLLANLLQGIGGQQASIFLLGAILGPLGIQSTIGYVLISAVVNIASQSLISLAVKKLIFKSQVDLELKAASDLAQKQEEIDSLFEKYRNRSPPLRTLETKETGIKDPRVFSSLSRGFDLLEKPWNWTKENKTSVLLAGIGYIVYKKSASQLVKNLASSFPNSIINLILTRGFNGLPIRDYAEKIFSWIEKKVKNKQPQFLKSLKQRIFDRITTKISSVAIASFFVETVAKTYFNTQVATLATLQNFDSISFNRSVYGFLSYLENVQNFPSNIGTIFEYLRDFPAVVQGGDVLLLETEGGVFEPAYRVAEDSAYISDVKTGELKSILEFRDQNPEILKRLFVSRNGAKTAILYSLEEWNRIGITDVSPVQAALKAGYPKAKIDQFLNTVQRRTGEIETSKRNLSGAFNLAKGKIDSSQDRFQFLLNNFEQIDENEFITLQEIKSKGNIFIDERDPETLGFSQSLKSTNNVQDAKKVLEDWKNSYILKNLQKLSFDLEDVFETYEDGLAILENQEKLIRDSVGEFSDTLKNFADAKTIFFSPLPFGQIRLDPLIDKIDPAKNPNFAFATSSFASYPNLTSSDNVETKVAETISDPTEDLNQNTFSSNLKSEQQQVQSKQIQGFDQKTSISIRTVQDKQREIKAALEYGISHAKTLDRQTALENQLSTLNKLKDLFSKSSTITPQVLDKNEFDSLYQTYETEFKESLETLKRTNPNIPANCFFDLTGKWETRKSQDGLEWIVVDSKTGNQIPSACIAKPIFVNLYNGARSLLKKILFLAGNKSGPLIAEVIFQSFDSIVLDIGKGCNDPNNSGSIHRGACLINSIFLQAVCQSNPSLCPTLNQYAFIDTREFIFGNYKTFASLISFLPQTTLDSVNAVGSTVSSSLETTNNLIETLNNRGEALEELENQRQKELETTSDSIKFIVDAKFFVKRQAQNLSDTAASVTNAFSLTAATISNFSKLAASLSTAFLQVGITGFKENPEFISQAIFGSKGLSSLRDSWDQFDRDFLASFGNQKEITLEDRLSVYSSSFYAWIQSIIVRLDLVLEGIKSTFSESIYFIEFVRSAFCRLFIGAPLLCSSPTLLEGIRETQGYSSIAKDHTKFFEFINGSKIVKEFLSTYQDQSILLIPKDEQFETRRTNFFGSKQAKENDETSIDFLKSFLFPSSDLTKTKVESLDFSNNFNANGNPFSFKKVKVDSIKSLGIEKSFGSEFTQIYFIDILQ